MKTKHFKFSRSILTALGMLACWFLPICVWASVQVDGIYYELNTSAKTAVVASNPDYYSGTVSIPSSFVYDGVTYRVTSIGSTAFLDCNGMTAIYMPNSVTTIASSAFERCKGLTNLKIGSGVTKINYEAFKNCSNLTSLILPASVKTISDEVFSGCTSLTEIVAERTTAPTISSTTFNGVDKTSCTVYVPEGYRSSYANAANWKTFSNIVERTVLATGSCGDNVTYTVYSDMTMVISGTGEMFNSFYWEDLDYQFRQSIKKVDIGEGVTSIAVEAFMDFSDLTSVTIPSSVTNIGAGAFSDCYSLNSVTIPSGVTSILDWVFAGCRSLISVTIPSGVTSIGEGAFTYCVGLTSVTIPNNVTSIGLEAFRGCSGLTSIEIPSSVTSIEEGAFSVCSGLISLTISNGVTDIGDHAFVGCSELTSVTIPNSVTYIGEGAFSDCEKLTSIIVSAGNNTFDSRNNCNAIIETASNTLICGCRNTIIPNSVTSIGNYAFSGSTGLTSVIIPNSVTIIGGLAFSGCTSLSSISIPNNVISIGRGAFDDTAWYYNLPDGLVYINQVAYHYKGTMPDWTNISINSGTVSISPSAFSQCTGLSSVTIPNSVTDIGDYAFSGCTRLYTITVERESPAPIGEYAFGEYAFNSVNKSYCTLYVPFGCKSAYENAEGWSEFENIEESQLLVGNLYYRRNISDNTVIVDRIVDNNFSGSLTIPESINYAGNSYTVTSIGYSAFSGCTGLTSIVIPNSVTSIGYSAFDNCTSLTSVEIPNSVTSIGSSAFFYCISLSSITIPSSVTSIGEYAFGWCTSLSSITIPSSVTRIDDYTFFQCASLSSITIPNSVTSIGYRAFEYCISLSSVNLPASVYLESNNDYIENLAFYGCSRLNSLVIPEGVQRISVGSFWECNSLSLTLPSSLSSISSRFKFDKYESDLTESGFWGVKSIIVDEDNPVFDSHDNCNAVIETATNKLLYGSKLTKVPDGVTTIGHYSLCNVSSIFIPSSVTTIEAGAFCLRRDFMFLDDWIDHHDDREYEYSSYLLDSIIMESDVPPLASFSGVNQETCLLLVPFGSKSAYQNASGWKDFQNIIEFEPDTDISALDNAIYVEQTEGRIGGTMDISVKLKNSYPVRGFQFKLELPEGTTINEWSLSTNRLPSGATLSDKIATQKIEGNKINVACSLNYGDATFTGNDGEIATVNVTFSDDMEVGSYPIYLTACDVTTAGGSDEDLSDVKSTLVLEDYLQGDANGDGKVRIGDATAILNYIVGSVPGNFQEKAADANGDGKIRIGDATAVLNIIVNQ